MGYLEEKITNYINITNENIDKKDFSKYIHGLYLTLCKKNILLYYFLHKITFIKNKNIEKSNKQIYLYLTNSIKNNDLDQYFRLQKLFDHFISFSLLNTINKKYLHFNNINNTNNTNNNIFTDSDIIKFILNNIDKQKYKKIKSNNKLKNLCSDSDFTLQYIALKFLKLHKEMNYSNTKINKLKYLDIGCGNAFKTKKFSKYIGFTKNQIYGTNIESWGPYNSNKSKLNIHFESIKNNKLFYNNHSFDFISCIFNLHHVENIDIFLQEISRILKKDGIFLLVEHDIYNDYDKLIINIQHMLYSALYDKKNNYIENPDYIYLLNKYEWSFLLKKYDLEFIKGGKLDSINEYLPRYDNRFYSFFIKK